MLKAFKKINLNSKNSLQIYPNKNFFITGLRMSTYDEDKRIINADFLNFS